MSSILEQHRFTRRRALALAAGIPLAGPALAAGDARQFRRGGMLYRQLGQTDLYVSALGFGSHTNPRFRVPDPRGTRLTEPGQKLRDRQIDKAIDYGVNLFDVYEDASQWSPMAARVQSKRDRVLLALRLNELPGPMADWVDKGARMFGHIDLCRFVVTEDVTPKVIEDWDALRKAKAAGKVRAIGIAAHNPEAMIHSLQELEGLDFLYLPFNFIHARVSYDELLPMALKQRTGLIAIKPLAAGSIVELDPLRPRPKARPEDAQVTMHSFRRHEAPLLGQAVSRLMRELDRSPDDTLAQAALRFVVSKRFISCALTGTFLEEELDENYAAVARYAKVPGEFAALDAARDVAALSRGHWLPRHYRWLDRQWKTQHFS